MKPEKSAIESWEDAYLRFETPAEEIAKFQKRLNGFHQSNWPRESSVVELFCGSGNGLVALENLGFTDITGIDISASLLSKYGGTAKTIVADCRDIPVPDSSVDIAIVQGGLHHLEGLKTDFPRTLEEVSRILKPGGRFVVVEPWMTLFLWFIHFVTLDFKAFNGLYSKFSAFHDMVRLEEETYIPWLANPAWIRTEFSRVFAREKETIGWGKLSAIYRTRLTT